MKMKTDRVRYCGNGESHFFEPIGFYDPKQNNRFIKEGYHCCACGKDFDINKKEIRKIKEGK